MNSFLKVSIVSGLLFGISTGILDVFLSRGVLYDIKITGATISGVLSGVCFGFIGYLLARSNSTSYLKQITKASSLIVTGLFLGVIAIIGLSKLPHGQWQQTTPPPEKPIQFLKQPSFLGSFYIQSENEGIFSYTCDIYNINHCRWNKQEAPPSESPANSWNRECNNGHLTEFLLTPIFLFKRIIDAHEYSECDGITIPVQTNFVLLNDGTIWVMTRIYPELVYDIIIPIWLATSSLIGFAGYLALLFEEPRDSIEKQHQHKNHA